MNKAWIILLLFLFIAPIGVAQDSEPIKQGECLPLVKYCSNCTFVNITSIEYPNGSIQALNYETEQISPGTFTNTTGFCGSKTEQVGIYEYARISDENGILSVDRAQREVTANGRASPTGIVIVVFAILYIAFIAVLVYFMTFTMMYFVEFLRLDVEKRPIYSWNDLLLNIAGYLAVWVFYYLELYYVGNPSIGHITGWLLFALTWTNLALPILAFILSFMAQGWEKVIAKIEGTDGN